jgi:hypothetical protein
VKRWLATLILASALVSLLLLLAGPTLASMSLDASGYGYDAAAQPRQRARSAERKLQIHLGHER